MDGGQRAVRHPPPAALRRGNQHVDLGGPGARAAGAAQLHHGPGQLGGGGEIEGHVRRQVDAADVGSEAVVQGGFTHLIAFVQRLSTPCSDARAETVVQDVETAAQGGGGMPVGERLAGQRGGIHGNGVQGGGKRVRRLGARHQCRRQRGTQPRRRLHHRRNGGGLPGNQRQRPLAFDQAPALAVHGEVQLQRQRPGGEAFHRQRRRESLAGVVEGGQRGQFRQRQPDRQVAPCLPGRRFLRQHGFQPGWHLGGGFTAIGGCLGEGGERRRRSHRPGSGQVFRGQERAGHRHRQTTTVQAAGIGAAEGESRIVLGHQRAEFAQPLADRFTHPGQIPDPALRGQHRAGLVAAGDEGDLLGSQRQGETRLGPLGGNGDPTGLAGGQRVDGVVRGDRLRRLRGRQRFGHEAQGAGIVDGLVGAGHRQAQRTAQGRCVVEQGDTVPDVGHPGVVGEVVQAPQRRTQRTVVIAEQGGGALPLRQRHEHLVGTVEAPHRAGKPAIQRQPGRLPGQVVRLLSGQGRQSFHAYLVGLAEGTALGAHRQCPVAGGQPGLEAVVRVARGEANPVAELVVLQRKAHVGLAVRHRAQVDAHRAFRVQPEQVVIDIVLVVETSTHDLAEGQSLAIGGTVVGLALEVLRTRPKIHQAQQVVAVRLHLDPVLAGHQGKGIHHRAPTVGAHLGQRAVAVGQQQALGADREQAPQVIRPVVGNLDAEDIGVVGGRGTGYPHRCGQVHRRLAGIVGFLFLVGAGLGGTGHAQRVRHRTGFAAAAPDLHAVVSRIQRPCLVGPGGAGGFTLPQQFLALRQQAQQAHLYPVPRRLGIDGEADTGSGGQRERQAILVAVEQVSAERGLRRQRVRLLLVRLDLVQRHRRRANPHQHPRRRRPLARAGPDGQRGIVFVHPGIAPTDRNPDAIQARVEIRAGLADDLDPARCHVARQAQRKRLVHRQQRAARANRVVALQRPGELRQRLEPLQHEFRITVVPGDAHQVGMGLGQQHRPQLRRLVGRHHVGMQNRRRPAIVAAIGGGQAAQHQRARRGQRQPVESVDRHLDPDECPLGQRIGRKRHRSLGQYRRGIEYRRLGLHLVERIVGGKDASACAQQDGTEHTRCRPAGEQGEQGKKLRSAHGSRGLAMSSPGRPRYTPCNVGRQCLCWYDSPGPAIHADGSHPMEEI